MDRKAEFLYLTTQGRKSGKPHEIEIWYVSHGGRYYLCAEQRERSDWVQNILNDPHVEWFVEAHTHTGLGRIVNAETEHDLHAIIAQLFDARYQWNDGLFVELRPEPEPTSSR
jgi:deazaflavin-dependent oxidoreductase (nitroreductase family)